MKRLVYSARSNRSYGGSKFDSLQLDEIEQGRQSGVDISVYADPKFKASQMEELREGLEAGVDVNAYADPKFDWIQMRQIREGLESGVDINLYSDSKVYEGWQMRQIREGLEAGVDVSVYSDPKFNWVQMQEIRKGLESDIDVSAYADPEYSYKQMREIRKCLEAGVDISMYANPKFNWEQMELIRKYLEMTNNDATGLDTATVAEIKRALALHRPLSYLSLSNTDKAKARWQDVKNKLSSSNYTNVPAIESEFELVRAEGSAASKLGLTFEENSDGSVTFFNSANYEIATLTAKEYDQLVIAAIKRSSTRSSFTKAFATQLKRALNL